MKHIIRTTGYLSLRKALKGYKPVTHCIFDVDGLLLDIDSIYDSVVRDIAASFGKPYPSGALIRIIEESREEKERRLALVAVNELRLPLTSTEFLNKYNALSRERLGKANLLKGAELILRHLYTNGIPLCLVTNSTEEMFAVKIKKYEELFNLFNYKVCGGSDPDVKRGKPYPDMYLAAASRFIDKPSPSSCLVFENTPNGVTAARSAGMQVIMIPDININPNLYKHATQVLYSLEHFKPEQFGLSKLQNWRKTNILAK